MLRMVGLALFLSVAPASAEATSLCVAADDLKTLYENCEPGDTVFLPYDDGDNSVLISAVCDLSQTMWPMGEGFWKGVLCTVSVRKNIPSELQQIVGG